MNIEPGPAHTENDTNRLNGSVREFLRQSAAEAGAPPPDDETDLFAEGILDSFSLLDYVSRIEETCGISIPEADLHPDHFRSVRLTLQYLESSAPK